MSKAKHTHVPGPWTMAMLSKCTAGIPDSLSVIPESLDGKRGPAICVVSPASDVTEQDEANAQLICAAPELLEACRKVMTYASLPGSVKDLVRAAIAKAEGARS